MSILKIHHLNFCVGNTITSTNSICKNFNFEGGVTWRSPELELNDVGLLNYNDDDNDDANESETEEIIEELQRRGVEAAGLELDLSQPTAPAKLFTVVQERFGQANILVNNAAYSTNENIGKLTSQSLDKHYAVNVRGMALLCQQFVQQFGEGKWVANGRIINLSSGQSFSPMPDELGYIASKGAVEAFSLSLSAALARQGITVNAIDPGITDTGWIPDDLRQTFVAQAPMQRIGTPEDAARLVRFLASPEAGWITGQLIRSRGGL